MFVYARIPPAREQDGSGESSAADKNIKDWGVDIDSANENVPLGELDDFECTDLSVHRAPTENVLHEARSQDDRVPTCDWRSDDPGSILGVWKRDAVDAQSIELPKKRPRLEGCALHQILPQVGFVNCL